MGSKSSKSEAEKPKKDIKKSKPISMERAPELSKNVPHPASIPHEENQLLSSSR